MRFNPETDVLLIDGSGFIFRAFYAIPYLTNSHGFPTNALYGFGRMLDKLLMDFRPRWVSVIFDYERENFRHKIFPEYKANRVQLPEELAWQMPYFSPLCESLGIATYAVKGYEADDVIGTLATRLDRPVTIVTGDKDFAQLVSDRVMLFDPAKDRWSGINEIVESYGGVTPANFVDYLAIVGDSSDNIPGVKGIGPKGAIALINHFGTIESCVNRLAEVRSIAGLRGKDKIVQALGEQSEQLGLSKILATIKTDVPLDQSVGDDNLVKYLERREPDVDDLRDCLSRFEFKDLFTSIVNNRLNRDNVKFESITIWRDQLADLYTSLLSEDELVVDVETTSLDPYEARVVGVALCCDETKAYYIPCGHEINILSDHDEIDKQVEWPLVKDFLIKLFKGRSVKFIGQNCKFDISILEKHGVSIENVYFDTMIAAWMIYPDRQSYSMDRLASDLLGYSCVTYNEVIGDNESMAQVSIADATKYAAEDAWVAFRLYRLLSARLVELKLDEPFYKIEMPLVAILKEMELRGMLVDVRILGDLARQWREELCVLEEQIFNLSGTSFNINSPQQLAEVLFDRLNLSTKGIKKTKKGFSTDSGSLEKLSFQHELPGVILAYRHLFKLLTTYAEALPKQVKRVTGRIHSTFRQTGTGTGRISSSDPNLQNIPVATPEGRRIRQAFVATPGYIIVAADYSQIELRLLAHLSGDLLLIEAFESNSDVHEITARELFGISELAPVSKEERRIGKTINFGIIYGMSAFRLSRELGIAVNEAEHYIDKYFKRYEGVKAYFDRCKQEAESLGEIRTLLGRRRVLTDISGASERDVGFLARVALNAPIQGSAADIVKLAMIEMKKAINEHSFDAFLLLQIHDELMYEVLIEQEKVFVECLKRCMEQVFRLKVPLKIDVESGYNWDDVD
jgi:DNA polymerase-1